MSGADSPLPAFVLGGTISGAAFRDTADPTRQQTTENQTTDNLSYN